MAMKYQSTAVPSKKTTKDERTLLKDFGTRVFYFNYELLFI